MAHSAGWQRGQLCFLNAWYLFPIVTDSSVQLLLLENNPSLCVAKDIQSQGPSCLPSCTGCAAKPQQASLNLTPSSLTRRPRKPATYRWYNLEEMKGKAPLRLSFLRAQTARGEWSRGRLEPGLCLLLWATGPGFLRAQPLLSSFSISGLLLLSWSSGLAAQKRRDGDLNLISFLCLCSFFFIGVNYS